MRPAARIDGARSPAISANRGSGSRPRPRPRPRAGKWGTGTGTGSGVSARPARNYAAQWQIEGRSGFRQGPAQRRLAFTRDPHAPHVSAIRLRPSESGTLPCSVTAECAHESAMRRIRASVPCRNPNERPRAIACSSRRSRLPAAAALCRVRELRRELSARGSTSKPSAAASALSASSCVHFEQQLDRTLVLPPMAVL
jgi:hypothetical protein